MLHDLLALFPSRPLEPEETGVSSPAQSGRLAVYAPQGHQLHMNPHPLHHGSSGRSDQDLPTGWPLLP